MSDALVRHTDSLGSWMHWASRSEDCIACNPDPWVIDRDVSERPHQSGKTPEEVRDAARRLRK